MDKDERANEDDTVLRAVHDAFSGGIPEEHKERLRQTLRGFRRDLAEHRYVRALNRKARGGSEEPRWRSLKRLRMSLALAAACGAVAVFLGLQFLLTPTTWASSTPAPSSTGTPAPPRLGPSSTSSRAHLASSS